MKGNGNPPSPLVRQSLGDGGRLQRAGRNGRMDQRKVVLVDDEEDIALYLQTALEDGGYVALTASNVPDGLELIRKERPDLVCLDILMPRESGFSLYQKI